MKVGYFTMPLHPPGSDPGRTLASDMAQIELLDRLGYVEAWIGEHITAEWENIPCPDLFIANALARTRDIVLATGVTCLPNHNPLMLAQRIAQLDQMAQGRFRWGIGSGGFPGDFELFEVDTERGEQRRLTREVLDAVLDLWDDPKPGRREHDRWRFRVPERQADVGLSLHMRPYQKPHPPIGVAGIGPKSDMLTLAGERRWIPMSINIVPTPVLRAHWQTYAESAERSGNPADRSEWRIARDVYIGESSAQARRDVLEGTLARDWREYFTPALTKAKMMLAPKIDQSMPDAAVTPEYMIENVWIVGDVDEVTARLQRLHDDVGGFGVLLAMGHEWTPPGKWERSMELLAREVIPRLPAG